MAQKASGARKKDFRGQKKRFRGPEKTCLANIGEPEKTYLVARKNARENQKKHSEKTRKNTEHREHTQSLYFLVNMHTLFFLVFSGVFSGSQICFFWNRFVFSRPDSGLQMVFSGSVSGRIPGMQTHASLRFFWTACCVFSGFFWCPLVVFSLLFLAFAFLDKG